MQRWGLAQGEGHWLTKCWFQDQTRSLDACQGQFCMGGEMTFVWGWFWINLDEFGWIWTGSKERERARGGGKGQILPLWSWTRHLPLYYSQQNQNLVKNVGSLEYVDYWPWTCWYLCRNATFKHNNSPVLNAIMPFNKDFTRNHAYVTDCIYKSEGLFENWFSRFSKLTNYCHLIMDSLMIHWYIWIS